MKLIILLTLLFTISLRSSACDTPESIQPLSRTTAVDYDSIYPLGDYFVIRKNGKYGIINEEQTALIPCFLDAVYIILKDQSVLSNQSGLLKKYSLTTGKEETIIPNATHILENTILCNVGDDFDPHYQEHGAGRNAWLFLDKHTQQIIGKPYYAVGLFDEKGHVIAAPFGKSYLIGLNADGQELKPGFHLECPNLIQAYVRDTLQIMDTVIQHLNRKGLLAAIEPHRYREYISTHFVIQTYEFAYFDDYGESSPHIQLEVYSKDSYFSWNTPFPENPKYVYNYFEKYSKISEPNKNGWRWALPNEGTPPMETYWDPSDGIRLEQTVLVHSDGTVLQKPNYRPVESQPFLELLVTHELHWDDLNSMNEVLPQLRLYFPTAYSLTDDAFLTRYKDSVYSETLPILQYDPETEAENTSYLYWFYFTDGLQKFSVAPPQKVQFEFFPENFASISGINTSANYNAISRFKVDSRYAYTFGETDYFVYPETPAHLTREEKRNWIRENYAQNTDPEVKRTLSDLNKYEAIIHSGFCRESFEMKAKLELPPGLMTYTFTPRMGVVLENSVLIPPKYLTIASDNSHPEKPVFILVDPDLTVYEFDIHSGKTRISTKLTYKTSAESELILQEKSTGLFHVLPTGSSYFNYQVSTDPVKTGLLQKEVKYFYNLRMENYGPIITATGEDSVRYTVDGDIEIVYHAPDTLTFGRFHTFPAPYTIQFFETKNGEIRDYNRIPVPEFYVNDRIRHKQMPLNFTGKRAFDMQERPNSILLSNQAGNTLEIPISAYEQLIQQNPSDNGYGGLLRKKTYIPYQTLLPFPEKHTVYIQTGENHYLVGKRKSLEWVHCDQSGKIVKRFPQKFSSYTDFRDKMKTNQLMKGS